MSPRASPVARPRKRANARVTCFRGGREGQGGRARGSTEEAEEAGEKRRRAGASIERSRCIRG
jgi:hypothetical protein